ncbi:TPA: hypothetical protein QFT98_002107 [Enterococcus faecium]|uniref:hypothetical protein n=1 Tax=Enterococcus TaxID=1350 RepID=UPI000B63389A|nr:MULTISPECIES: hypothetical protein [Enterococcus]MCV3097295.1 hypothetical protein [Enterococcus hirae]MCV3124891.1 hypothetical protein [Enterococcus hirae]OTO56471.1 hypothetical protein A5813_001955 [Enterococcus faecium]OTO61558.1 hypothetical protein A5812_000464 [Enterococcus faecium]
MQEKRILKKLGDFGITDIESFLKLKQNRIVRKFGFSEDDVEFIEFMKANVTEHSKYRCLLEKEHDKQPKKFNKFFKEYGINYETIFDTRLSTLVKHSGEVTPAKIQEFLNYKNNCLRLKYNDTDPDNQENVYEQLLSVFMHSLIYYLNEEDKNKIYKVIESTLKKVELKSVDIGCYAESILKCIDFDYLLQEKCFDIIQKIILNILKKEKKSISLFLLKRKIREIIYCDIDVQPYLLQLTKEGFVLFKSEGIKYYMPRIDEYIKNNLMMYPILNKRLSGFTLEMIGNLESVTRERIRQKEKVELKKIPYQEIYESTYLKYYKEYSLTSEEFCEVFSFTPFQYRFLSLYNKVLPENQMKTKDKLMESDQLTFKERERLGSILNADFFIFGNKKIRRKKIDLIEYLIEVYAREETTLEEFCEQVKAFNDFHQLNFDFSSNRAIEGIINRANNVLLKYGKRIIHYQVDPENVISVLKQIGFKYYINQEISAQRIIKDYKMELNQIDIYDEYELHNLLKRYVVYLPDYVNLKRMPFIEIGDADREEQVLNLLIELSPVSVDDFVEVYSERYGVSEKTIRANFLKVIDEFKSDEVYYADKPPIDIKMVNQLENLLTDTFYFKEDVYELYQRVYGPCNIPDFVFPQLGYKSYANFILQSNYNRADVYFEELYLAKDIFYITDTRFYLLGSFRNKLENLKSEYKVFEYAKNSFISIDKLKNFADITENDITGLLNDIGEYVGDCYFTVDNIEFIIEKSKLNMLGFENIFYESILKGAKDYRYQYMGGITVFKRTKEKFYSYDLVEEIVFKYKAIDIYDLMDLLDNNYGIKLSKEKILSNCNQVDLYYNPLMEMIYTDIDKFYEMMEE